MRELLDILQHVDATPSTHNAILATVVDVNGSGYRIAGARMLIDENGYTIGSLSGGCLESDVLERAKNVLKTSEPVIIVYDSTGDENSVFGLQMGCRGVVRVLLERAHDARFFRFLRNVFSERKTSAIATVISSTGPASPEIGQRFYWKNDFQRPNDDDRAFGLFWPALESDIRDSVVLRRSRTRVYPTPNGECEVFIEVIEPPPNILIFGAGHDAIPLAYFAKQLGWIVNVNDRRSAFATHQRFPMADRIVVGHASEIDEDFFIDENSIAVVMTHHFESDRGIVRRLVSSPCRYIGILGPKQRTADILKDLQSDGVAIDREIVDRILAPVGLDIGASTPEGIALSIVAGIQAALAGRDGGQLKHRTKPIYDR